MSPVSKTPGLISSADAAVKGPVELSAAQDGPSGTTSPATVPSVNRDGRDPIIPTLKPGKLIPGPEDWRALERRASSFRA